MSVIQFVPYARRAALGDAVTVRANGRDATVALAHFGPGDVIGLERAEIVSRTPAPGSVDFAPNLMPFVELRSADLPWRMSSGPAPWLALVVREAPGDALIATGGPLLALVVPGDQLPPWDERGLWCHAQVGDDGDLERGFARVIAPRRLAPQTRYVACLVPCFEAGRRAGLGLPVGDPQDEGPAWTVGVEAVLPVYDHWYFTTAPAGDFEALARRLVPQVLRASARPATVDFTAIDADAEAATPWFSALVPTDHVASPPPAGAAAQLGVWLDAATRPTPTLGLPVYGAGPASAQAPTAGWQGQLNRDPRARAAAGLGAEAVRAAQDELVAEAWRQLGDLRRANRERDHARLGALVLERWTARHVVPLAPAARLALAAPGLHRLRRAGTPLVGEVQASVLPQGLLAASFRRWRARLPRAQRGSLDAAIADAAIAQSRLGEAPPPPAELPTPATLAALLAKAPLAPTPDKDSPWAARRAVVLAEAEALRDPSFSTVRLTRPPALAVAAVAEVATSALTEARALDRQVAGFDPGEVVTRVDATRPLVGEVSLEVPIGELLRRRDPRFLVASVELPPDAVGVLRPNPAFIEAVLIGANDELLRELRWRGADVDPRATPLGRFFDVRGRTSRPPPDLGAIASWTPASELGSHLATADLSVLVVRGELVRRFADAVIYAAPASRTAGRRHPSATGWREPVFRGLLTDDTLFVGFDRSPAQLRDEGGDGWYVVLAERPGGTRFGLDEGQPEAGPLATWDDLRWGQVAVAGGYVQVAAQVPAPSATGGVTWGADGAHQAAITRQRPMRVAFHAAELIAESA